ncbi:MAG: thioredoxin family protein [Thermoplasmatota archaeon]
MVKTESAMVPLGAPAPDFMLPATDGTQVSRSDFQGKPLLVVFMCNHCPFVIHIADVLAKRVAQWQGQGIAVVGINSNDVANYPDDSPEKMVEEVANRGYTFPYLFDESQDVARAYDARCTPDFFLYDAEHRLAYRGQFDASRPSLDTPVTGDDLDAAVQAVLRGEVPEVQAPSLGCNIKWKG